MEAFPGVSVTLSHYDHCCSNHHHHNRHYHQSRLYFIPLPLFLLFLSHPLPLAFSLFLLSSFLSVSSSCPSLPCLFLSISSLLLFHLFSHTHLAFFLFISMSCYCHLFLSISSSSSYPLQRTSRSLLLSSRSSWIQLCGPSNTPCATWPRSASTYSSTSYKSSRCTRRQGHSSSRLTFLISCNTCSQWSLTHHTLPVSYNT